MKLTAQELNVIIDTLLRSTEIVGDTVFTYTRDTREELATELINRADVIWIGVDTEEPKGS